MWEALGASARGWIRARAQGKAMPCTAPPVQKSFGRFATDRMSPTAGDFFPMRKFAKGVILVAGKRQPTALIKANGRKHLSKAEEAERLAAEPKVEAPDFVTPPKWLAKRFHAEFLEIGQLLLDAGLYTKLDRDVLGQYFSARDSWLKANKKAAAAIRSSDEKMAQSWTSVQNAYFKQARQCGEAMGLSVTSRCRLVMPEGVKQKEKEEEQNPFLQIIEGGVRYGT